MKKKVVSGMMLTLLLTSMIGISMIGITTLETHDIAVDTLDEYYYAGGSNPGVVYEYYTGGTQWNIISPTLGYAVLSLCEYEGQLYAGTMSTSSHMSGIGRVWRYDGGTTWTMVGDNMDNQTCSLVVFRGNLYAGTARGQGRLYRYDGGTTWTMVVSHTSWSGFRSLYVWNDILYIGDIGYDLFGHYDGTTFTYDADLGGSCIWDYEVYDNNLYASAYNGRVHRSFDGTTWTTIRDYADYHSWELETFQGDLYVTTRSRLERYDGVGFSSVWTEPYGYEIISMINAGDTLILGTGEEAGYGGIPGVGRVYTYDGTQVQLISGDIGSGIQALLRGSSYRHEHDLKVSLEAPTHLEPNHSALLNATVYNYGLSNETNVELQLLINGTIVDSVLIPELLTSSSYTLSYFWTPVKGIYNVTAYAPPVLGETFTTNNVASKIVQVYKRDVAVVNVTPSKTVVGQGYFMFINVTVENQGNFTETFNVTAYYGNATITPEQWEIFWSMGDVNRDGYIDDTDGDLLEAAYGSTPGHPNWNPDADLNQDLSVDRFDWGIYTFNYGLDIWTHFISGGPIGKQTIFNLPNGTSTILTFTWNTTGVPYGNYTISAVADTVPDETDTTDNTYVDGWVIVTVVGDIWGDPGDPNPNIPDGDVDRYDGGIFAGVYGRSEGDPDYMPEADFVGDPGDPNPNIPDGDVDRYDGGILSQNYGRTV